jgi:hypothetical protein
MASGDPVGDYKTIIGELENTVAIWSTSRA